VTDHPCKSIDDLTYEGVVIRSRDFEGWLSEGWLSMS
jgi:hypothetical protein